MPSPVGLKNINDANIKQEPFSFVIPGRDATHVVLSLHSAAPSSLALDGFHSCGIERLLWGWSARVSRVLCVIARGLPLCMVHVVDGHQQAVVHYLEALQHLMGRKDTVNIWELSDFFRFSLTSSLFLLW